MNGDELLNDFITECCVVGPELKEKGLKIYERYVEWYRAHVGKRYPSGIWFRNLLSKKFEKIRIDGCVAYQGIAIRTEKF